MTLTKQTAQAGLLAIVVVLMTALPAMALDHTGIISTDQTWFATDNPHNIIGHVTVQAGAVLTIEDGVEIFGNSGRVLNIYGQLDAFGSSGNGISFQRAGTSNWGGLRFYGDGFGTLENCLIDHGSTGIALNTTGSVDVFATTITNGVYGVNATSGNISFINTKIINNSNYGVYVQNGVLQFGSNLSEWNDIYGNGTPGSGRDYRNGPNDVHAGWVYWGTMHQVEIWANTWDELDDDSLGLIDWIPHANADHVYVITGVEGGDGVPGATLPSSTEMFQNHPNPFNPSTTISFDLHKESAVNLKVFDISGAKVATLVDDMMTAGHHNVVWNGVDDRKRSVASGVYFYQFQAGEVTETKRMMLVR